MSAGQKPLVVRRLGLSDYQEVLELQRELHKKVIGGAQQQYLIVCEHPAVITFGSQPGAENLLMHEEKLRESGIKVFKTERGGNITAHGPGQIVLYPILDLNLHKRDVNWYMRSLEEVVINTLEHFGIAGMRLPGKTGVWISGAGGAANEKIASIGVRISRWVTMHGLSLNVQNSLDVFRYIHPCGFKDVSMTEMQKFTKILLDKQEVADNLIASFLKVFGIQDK